MNYANILKEKLLKSERIYFFNLFVIPFSLFLIPLLLIIFFTKLTDEDKAKLSAAEVWTGDVTGVFTTR